MKRNSNLDFTPLLDVIMILLFIVLAGIGQRAQVTKNELAAAETEIEGLLRDKDALESDLSRMQEQNGAMAQELDTLNEQYSAMGLELDSLTEQNEEMASELDTLTQQYGEMGLELDAITEQYSDLLAITEYSKNKLYAYPAVLRRVTKVSLVCTPEEDAISGNWLVRVDLYLDKTYDNDLVYADSFELVHDYELSPGERQKVNAKQELQLTRFLKRQLMKDTTEYCYVTIQYPADDENFSSLDLDILERSVNNIQNELDLRCYIERAGIH